VLSSCGVFKRKKTEEKRKPFGVFVENLNKASFNLNYLTEKWAVRYASDGRSVSFNVRMVLIKDSLIYFSVSKFGFPVGKALITPEKAAYYESVGGTYYEGNLSDISQMIGLDLNFNQLQSLITGDTPVPIQPGKWIFNLSEKKEAPYVLKPEFATPVKRMDFTSFFKVYSAVFEHNNRSAVVIYKSYFEKPLLPQFIHLANDKAEVEIKVKKIDIDKKPHFRFKIPRNYRKPELE
jgi:hypothetical protein